MVRMRETAQPIEADIKKAGTLPSAFYRDEKIFETVRERIFARSWQFLSDTDAVKVPGQACPVTCLPGYLDEPLLLTRDSEDKIHCLSNVCTHRGNLLVEGECHAQQLRCRYHGRRFGLDGCYLSAPGFEKALDFPTERDNLSTVPMGIWEKFVFASVDPAFGFDDVLGTMKDRLSWIPVKDFVLDPTYSRDYMVKANWALYVDNYLEGLHVPYVHPGLAAFLDSRDYRSELERFSNVQVGAASKPEDAFEIPKGHPDHGRNIGAYYYFLFPNTMFNFYPWGLSINIVMPLAVDRTRVRFLSYVWEGGPMEGCSPQLIEKTEREDEDVVEKVQKGVRSRFYKRGRYSPEWEQNVHHFHRLLTEFLAD